MRQAEMERHSFIFPFDVAITISDYEFAIAYFLPKQPAKVLWRVRIVYGKRGVSGRRREREGERETVKFSRKNTFRVCQLS